MTRDRWKQVYDLTPADFDTSPVWSFTGEADEESDECTVMPVDPRDFDYETMYVARATFVLADGESWLGFLQPDQDLGVSQPCVFSPGGPVSFWHGSVLDADAIRHWYASVGKSADEIFPIRWQCAFVGPAEPLNRSGAIEGFGHIGDDGTPRVVR